MRRVVLLLAVVAMAALAWGAGSLGHLLHHEDPLEHADVVFVLGGSRLERAAEAGDLILEGWAPRALLSRALSDGAEIALRKRGIDIPAPEDMQRSVLLKMGVPAEAVEIIDREQVTTGTESDYLLELARVNQWSRIIVVTARLHTARARLALRRRFDGTGVRIIMRATRYDAVDIDRWWTSRDDLRFALIEVQKLAAYWIGVID